jgi:hypothetical protein
MAGKSAGVAAVLLGLLPALALAQPAAGTAERLFEASRTAFAALDEAERRKIQDDLVWVSTYRGMVDGGFGRGTFAALASFELGSRTVADGILDGNERALLAQSAEAARRAVDWRTRDEPLAGARFGYPAQLLPTERRLAGGVLLSGPGGLALNVERVAAAAGPAGLASLYEKMKAEQPGRKLTYAVQRPDWFVLTTEAGGRRGYSRFAATPAGAVGFTFAYDAAFADGEKLAVAIVNGFEPVAARPAEAAAVVEAARPVEVVKSAAAAAGAASGLVVVAGRVVTVARCTAPHIGGRPATVVATQGGLALLAADGLPVPADLAAMAAADGEVVALMRVDGALTAASGTATAGGRVVVAAAPGAAVFDRGGGFVGLLTGQAPRLAAGGTAETALPLVAAADVAALAGGLKMVVPSAAALTAGELARRYGKAVVQVDCGG